MSYQNATTRCLLFSHCVMLLKSNQLVTFEVHLLCFTGQPNTGDEIVLQSSKTANCKNILATFEVDAIHQRGLTAISLKPVSSGQNG